MGLLSKFKSSSTDAPARPGASSADDNEIVRDARTKARRRLIGAALLLGVGIIGFPILFETQPRPIAVDIPIEIPSRDNAAPLASPASRQNRRSNAVAKPPVEAPPPNAVPSAAAETPVEPASTQPRATDAPHRASAPEPKPTPPKPEVKPETKPEVKPEPKPAAKPPEPKPEAKSETKPERKPEPKPEPKPETKPEAKPTGDADKPEAASDSGRFVVQIGAFAEATSAREARMKVEGLGLKTYTQVIESATGRRIRVRVGPYATKAEAEKAAARIKSSGLQAAVLVL